MSLYSQLRRLDVMMRINHPEEYYQQALKSKGILYEELTHEEISVFKATCKAIEADILIEISEKLPKANSIETIDISRIAP